MRLRVILKSSFTTCVLLSAIVVIASFNKHNETVITNGIIKADIYLPNNKQGYYRAVRFDWAGIIGKLDCNNHSYYGQWFNDYNPFKDDAVTGPVEAFDPIGFDGAKSGDTFIKIGVGVLLKPDDSSYRFSRPYKLLNQGQWDVKTKRDRVIFTQTLTDNIYSYRYQKTVQLVKGEPALLISHTLKNTGEKTMETSVFDHNFLVMDSQPTGPGFSLTFPFDLTGLVNRKPDYIELKNNQLIYLKNLDGKFVSFADLTNGKGCNNYDFRVENNHTGAAVRITADKPISKMAFWSADKTICPEPYIKIKVEPGKISTWTIRYDYYTCNISR